MAEPRACSSLYSLPSYYDFLEQGKLGLGGAAPCLHCGRRSLRCSSRNEKEICVVPFAWEEKPGTPKRGRSLADNLLAFDPFAGAVSFSDINSSSFSSEPLVALSCDRRCSSCLQARSDSYGEEFRPLTPPPRFFFLPPAASPAPPKALVWSLIYGRSGNQFVSVKRRMRAFLLFCFCSSGRRRREPDPFLVAMAELREKEEAGKRRRAGVGGLGHCLSWPSLRRCSGGRRKKNTNTNMNTNTNTNTNTKKDRNSS